MFTSSSLRTYSRVFAVYRQNLGKGLGIGCIEFFYKEHLSVIRRTAIHPPSSPPDVTPIESINARPRPAVISGNRVRTAAYILLPVPEGQKRGTPIRNRPQPESARPARRYPPLPGFRKSQPLSPETTRSPFASIPAGSHPARTGALFPASHPNTIPAHALGVLHCNRDRTALILAPRQLLPQLFRGSRQGSANNPLQRPPSSTPKYRHPTVT